MDYLDWRDEVFGTPDDFDPVMSELSESFYGLDEAAHLNHIDRALIDDQLHDAFSVWQIGHGLNLIYSNACSDLPFCYTELTDESRRVRAVRNLRYLYSHFFDRYCTWPVQDIGNDLGSDETEPIGYVCYMFWEMFVLYPGNASPAVAKAALGTMAAGLNSTNDHSIVSAIHGLGHWVPDIADAGSVLKQWLRSPTTNNPRVVRYAKQATTGYIL